MPEAGDVLSPFLDRLRKTLQGGLTLPDANAEAAATSLGLFRGMVSQAEALNVLGETEFAEAGAANRRSLFEAWIQIRYILKCAADRRQAAVKCRVFALFEFRDFLTARGADPSDIAIVDAELTRFRTSEPTLVAEVHALRAGKLGGSKFYWTGLGPTALVGEVQKTIDPTTRLADYYKFESWDAHHVMGPLLEVNVTMQADGPHIQFGPRQPPHEAAAFSEVIAVYMLADAWQLLETELAIQPRIPFAGAGEGF